MTYSFPCQDLSLAGKQKGMSKGGNTRSGLLWEVERLINEFNELPQVLLMENVTQIHSNKNNDEFIKWMMFLESKGYLNFCADLNSKNYGVPQNRNRTYMISILGKYNYSFPTSVELTQAMQDRLELTVDEKYYINTLKSKELISFLINKGKIDGEKTVTGLFSQQCSKFDKKTDTANTLLARDYKGFGNQSMNGIIEKNTETIENSNKYRIRKLTPKECFRLMDFDDDDYEKCASVNSDCQLYKQAGNSIVVAVLEAIFKQML